MLGHIFSHVAHAAQIAPLLRAYQGLRLPRTAETQRSSRVNQTARLPRPARPPLTCCADLPSRRRARAGGARREPVGGPREERHAVCVRVVVLPVVVGLLTRAAGTMRTRQRRGGGARRGSGRSGRWVRALARAGCLGDGCAGGDGFARHGPSGLQNYVSDINYGDVTPWFNLTTYTRYSDIVGRWVAQTGGEMSFYICSTNTVGRGARRWAPPRLHDCRWAWVEVTVSRRSDFT